LRLSADESCNNRHQLPVADYRPQESLPSHWDAFLEGRFDLCVSNEILDEYQEILGQQITPTVAENVVLLILNQENVQPLSAETTKIR